MEKEEEKKKKQKEQKEMVVVEQRRKRPGHKSRLRRVMKLISPSSAFKLPPKVELDEGLQKVDSDFWCMGIGVIKYWLYLHIHTHDACPLPPFLKFHFRWCLVIIVRPSSCV